MMTDSVDDSLFLKKYRRKDTIFIRTTKATNGVAAFDKSEFYKSLLFDNPLIKYSIDGFQSEDITATVQVTQINPVFRNY